MSELTPNLGDSYNSSELNQELDEAIFGFEDMQAELNYRQAQSALRDLVENLDLTPQERRGLETEIGSLESMLDKLDRQVVHIAVFGMVGRGKSSLLNALLGDQVFETGPIHGVTRVCQSANWTITQEAVDGSDRPCFGLCYRVQVTPALN